MNDGHTAFTRMPAWAYSSAAVRVIPMTACLLVAYATWFGKPISPASEAVLTIAPLPWGNMTRASHLRHSHTPIVVTATTPSKDARAGSGVAPIPSPTPALL